MTSNSAQGAATPSAVDVGFCQDMVVHHEQAVFMSQLVRAHTADVRVAALAAGIEDEQLLDIGAMRGYLTLWKAPALPSGPPMAWMISDRNHLMPVATNMPGLASAADLDALSSAKGKAMDVMFLRLMLRHHEGGLSMLNQAASRGAIPAIRGLASRLAFGQSQEIQTIRTMLNARTHGTDTPIRRDRALTLPGAPHKKPPPPPFRQPGTCARFGRACDRGRGSDSDGENYAEFEGQGRARHGGRIGHRAGHGQVRRSRGDARHRRRHQERGRHRGGDQGRGRLGRRRRARRH
jgi:uncharacterized protein (DUF305 family)